LVVEHLAGDEVIEEVGGLAVLRVDNGMGAEGVGDGGVEWVERREGEAKVEKAGEREGRGGRWCRAFEGVLVWRGTGSVVPRGIRWCGVGISLGGSVYGVGEAWAIVVLGCLGLKCRSLSTVGLVVEFGGYAEMRKRGC